MANLNFPTNPNIGDTHTVGSKVYTWNGYAWIVTGYSVSATSLSTTGTVSVSNTTNSTGTTSGAIVVGGGVGIAGDLYVGGAVYSGGASGVISANTGSFVTLAVTSTTNSLGTNSGALTVTGGVGIGGDLWVGGQFFAGGGLVLTTASFNNSFSAGDDISLTPVTTGSSTFLIIGNISTLQSVTGRGATTTNIVTFANTSQSTSTNTGAVLITGGLGVGKRVTAESLRIADAVLDSTQTLVNTTASTVIDTYSLNEFRSAKYLIQIDEGIGAGADFELREILLVADNDGNVWATEYGVVTSNGDLGTFEAEISGTDVKLYFTPYAATNKTVKVLRTGMAV